MNTLIIGSGGRESAFLHGIRRVHQQISIFSDSPNALMAQTSKAIGPISTQNIESLIHTHKIELVIIGPEKPLVEGLANKVRQAGALAFGPEQIAAQLEGSKIFAKSFMQEFNVPTAHARTVNSISDVEKYINEFTAPYVLKADGLCAGKGVFICKDKEELLDAGQKIFVDKTFGDQGERALLEQFEPGDEISYFFLTNGDKAIALPLFRDHKRLLDGDKGPNTGGMGVIGPIEDSHLEKELFNKVLQPTLDGIKKRGFKYRGIVFVGVMLTKDGPKVLEYNVRFGDPETQCLIPSLDQQAGDDWLSVFSKIAKGEMPHMIWHKDKVACVVGATSTYPDSAKKQFPIEGAPYIQLDRAYVLHAGTQIKGSQAITSGGRVLNFIGSGETYQKALDQAYALTKQCYFEGMQFRKDIGHSLVK